MAVNGDNCGGKFTSCYSLLCGFFFKATCKVTSHSSLVKSQIFNIIPRSDVKGKCDCKHTAIAYSHLLLYGSSIDTQTCAISCHVGRAAHRGPGVAGESFMPWGIIET